MFRYIIIGITLVLLGLGCRERAPQVLPPALPPPAPPAAALQTLPLATFFEVRSGDRMNVNTLTIEVVTINALTANGCQGGPIGCPDSVELKISTTGGEQLVTLAVLGGSRQTASSERIIFGHRIVLSEVNEGRAVIGIFLASPPIIPQRPQ